MWRLPYFLIIGYRRFVSPLLPATCRFHPSCSAYSSEAFRQHGLFKGFKLTIWRIAKCHPWHPGGNDPVPKKESCSCYSNENSSKTLSTPYNGENANG